MPSNVLDALLFCLLVFLVVCILLWHLGQVFVDWLWNLWRKP